MDTYKIFYSTITDDLDKVRGRLLNPSVRTRMHTILDRHSNTYIENIPLKHEMRNLDIADDALWGRLSFQKARFGYNLEGEPTAYREPDETEFCYFKENGTYYCIMFKGGNGRNELRWYFRETYSEKKSSVIKNEEFPENLIMDFMKRNRSIPKQHHIPQHIGTRDYIIVGGTDLNKDDLVSETLASGDMPKRSVLDLPSYGMGIKINVKGTVQNFSLVDSRNFIKFLRAKIMPLL